MPGRITVWHCGAIYQLLHGRIVPYSIMWPSATRLHSALLNYAALFQAMHGRIVQLSTMWPYFRCCMAA
jgi:hypothetical protein